MQQEKENAKATAEIRLRRELSPRPGTRSRRLEALPQGQPSLLQPIESRNHLTLPLPTISSIISQTDAEELMKRCEEITVAVPDSSASEKENAKDTTRNRLRRGLTQLTPRLRPRSRRPAALPQEPQTLLQPGGTRNHMTLQLPTISSIISQSNAEEILKMCEEIRVADSSASTTRSNSVTTGELCHSQCNYKFGLKWNKNWRLRKEP